MNEPKVSNPVMSVIVPAYNRAHLIPRAIRSVLNQTFHDFELIIVDDGSTDNTKEVVTKIEDFRIRYIRQENKGRSAARNTGIVEARGQFITFLDSDDEALPGWLECFIQTFKKSEVGIVCGGFIKILDRDKQNHRQIILPQERPEFGNQRGLFLAGTFAVRQELLKAVGGYIEGLEFSENTELAFRLVPYCEQFGHQVISLTEPLVLYYKDTSHFPRAKKNYRTHLESAKLILSDHGERLREKFPRGYANYCAIAGVNSLRLGRHSEARKFFLSAIHFYPWNMRHYLRLFLALIPPLGRKFWL